MKRTSMMMAGVALLMVMGQVGSDAQQVQPPQQPQRAQRAQRQTWLQRLDLTAEQQTLIDAISERHHEAATEARAALIQAEADLKKLGLEEEPDLRELERAMNALSQLQNAQKVQAMRNRAEMLDVLTEEQQQVGRSMVFPGMRSRVGRSGVTFRRGTMGRGMSRFDQGRGAGRGQAGFGQGMPRNTGRAGMRGNTRSMRPRGQAIPPAPGNSRQLRQNRMDQPDAQGGYERGMMRGRGRAVTPPPPLPPPAV